jgi:hypothetical protein
MANITSAGVFHEEGREPPGYVDPRSGPEPAEPADPPAKSAPKADWVEHAVEVTGVDPEQAQAMTKAELVETVAAVPPPPPPAVPGG